jgi:hypothetical protein
MELYCSQTNTIYRDAATEFRMRQVEVATSDGKAYITTPGFAVLDLADRLDNPGKHQANSTL